ncbi:hypothetical protein VTJ49DRAFT_7015 [Mycothermus thermophilus]|uniref:Signal recognition particle receptor subunit beta n=1 Tax=Humicola insolens TaxID=85995 RepID=A0ABR3VI20_HUMIN
MAASPTRRHGSPGSLNIRLHSAPQGWVDPQQRTATQASGAIPQRYAGTVSYDSSMQVPVSSRGFAFQQAAANIQIPKVDEICCISRMWSVRFQHQQLRIAAVECLAQHYGSPVRYSGTSSLSSPTLDAATMTALETLKDLFEASLKPSPTVITVGLVIVLLVPILLHFLYTAATPYTSLPAVLLIGPSGSGKTALLTLFERGPFYHNKDATNSDNAKPSVSTPVAETHTTQVPSAVELAVSSSSDPTSPATISSYRTDLDAAGAQAKKFLLVDTPGHPKLRGHALASLAQDTPTISVPPTPASSFNPSNSNETNQPSKIKAVLFLIDAAALADSDSPYLSTAAEHLHDALLALQRRHRARKGSRAPPAVPVLVAANKLDLFTALPAALVKSNLEAEISRIRRARSKGLLSSDRQDADGLDGDEDEADGWLGSYGSEKFSFKEMLEFDIEVEVLGGNVVGEGPGAEKWWRWIAERI